MKLVYIYTNKVCAYITSITERDDATYNCTYNIYL